ncbi:MAG: acyl-CoA desaturase [Bacteroidetes bacterium]|nr:acyl-CoA desaturase [Bacteroidota bacterium]
MKTITFNQKEHQQFWSECREKVEDYLKQQRNGRHASNALWGRMLFLVLLFISCYIAIFAFQPSYIYFLLICITMGLTIASIGFNISHQAVHGCISSNPMVNKLFGYSFNLVGMSDQMWKIKHNVYHHAYTNIYAYDEALKEDETFRFSQDARWLPRHQFQHIYGFFAYAAFTFFWAFWLDFEKWFRYKNVGVQGHKIKYTHSEKAIFWLTKIYYIVAFLVIPAMVLPYSIGQMITGFLLMHLVSSTFITHVLQVKHLNESTQMTQVDQNGFAEHSWAVNQLIGTSNFTAKNPIWQWFIGGVNYQVEHHLFPNVASCHLPHISEIVQETATKHGLPYYMHPNFNVAMVSHYKFLKELGQKPLATSQVSA